MADNSMRITGPVKIDQTSQEAVAFKLMDLISSRESVEVTDRKYWLTLYRQCYKATNGNSLESILKQD